MLCHRLGPAAAVPWQCWLSCPRPNPTYSSRCQGAQVQGRARRGLHRHGCSRRNGPALFNRSSHWQSISSPRRLISQHRHSSVPQSEPSAAASLRAGLSHLSSPPRRLAPLRPPRLPLRRDAACGAAVPPWPCYPAAEGHAPAPSLCPAVPEPQGQWLCTRRCPHGAILNGARGPPGMSMPVRVHVAAAAGGTAALDVARPLTRLVLGHRRSRRGAGCRLCRAAAEGCPSQREREAGLSAGFSGSAASNLWQLRACLPCQGSTVAPASQGSDRRCLEDRHRARRKRAGKGAGTSAAPRPGCLGTAAPRGCSRGPGFAAPPKAPSQPSLLLCTGGTKEREEK